MKARICSIELWPFYSLETKESVVREGQELDAWARDVQRSRHEPFTPLRKPRQILKEDGGRPFTLEVPDELVAEYEDLLERMGLWRQKAEQILADARL